MYVQCVCWSGKKWRSKKTDSRELLCYRLKEINFPIASDETLLQLKKNTCAAMHKVWEKTIPPKIFLKHKRPGWNPSLNTPCRRSKAIWKQWKASDKPNSPTNPARESYLRQNVTSIRLSEFGSTSRVFFCIPIWTWITTQKNILITTE